VSPDGPRCSRARLAGAVFVACVVLSACGNAGDGTPVGAQPVAQPSVYVLPPPTSDPSVETATTAPPAAAFVRTLDGVVLPDRVVTPGSVFGDVATADICDPHYTQGVRQPSFNTKTKSFAEYGVSIHDRDIYKVDHLVPIALGGDNTVENVWPQPYDARAGADQKDLLERQLRGLVCSGSLSLDAARQAIVNDWWSAFNSYMGLPIEPGTDGPAPPATTVQTAGVVVRGGSCLTKGEIAYEEPKHIRLICTETSDGELRWQRRS
jgi:hypothetical protein